MTAEPDGTFTLTSDVTPVRVRQRGTWRAIDTSLQRRADGTVAPIATAEHVTFSGGGDAPAVRVVSGGASLSFTLAGRLPRPTLHGDTAVYRSVLPGVDLLLTARASSYSEVLEVHDAAAAANPALRHLAFSVQARGVRVTSDSQGGLEATDAAGHEKFHGSQPVMWDSQHPARTPAPTAQRPGTGRISRLGMSLPATDATHGTATTTMTLTAPAAALSGRRVRYPVFIDPPLTPARSHFAVVTTKGNWHYYDDTSNDLKVGYCDNWPGCDGSWRARTYLSFPTDALTGEPTTAKVFSAKVEVYEFHSAHACTKEPVDLYSAGSISSSTDWPGPIGSKLDETSSGASDDCPGNRGGDVTFSASKVVSRFQSAANQDTKSLVFALRSPNENDRYQWKRFDSAGGSSGAAAQLEVHYDFPPSTPSGPTMDNLVACSGYPTYTRDRFPNLHAAAIDYDSPRLTIGMHFTIATSSGTRVRYNPTGVPAASGAVASWATAGENSNNGGALSDGSYKYDAYATSRSSDTADAVGRTTAWRSFTLDSSAPAIPTISSFSYPQNAWGTPANGDFTFGGSSDTAGFVYSFDSSGTEPVPTDSTCSYTTTPTASGGRVAAASGAATITVPDLAPGYHTIYAQAFDRAHNVSGETAAYVFYQSPVVSGEGAVTHEGEHYPPTSGGAGCADGGCSSYNETGPLWSNGSELHLDAATASTASPADFTSTFSNGVEADYGINVQVTKASNFGDIEFLIDADPNSPHPRLLTAPDGTYTFSLYDATTQTENIALGGVHLTAGQHTITYRIVGADPASSGESAGIDYFRVVPINNAVYGSLDAAMNNDGITADNGPAGDISLGLGKRSLSQNALTAAGFGPGATVSVDAGTPDATTFRMPGYNSDGSDNVIAMGQTIPLPAPVAARYVDLLVLSSCGDTPYSPSVQLSVNFADDTFSSTPTPQVPDFLSGTITTAPGQESDLTRVLTMNYMRSGTATDTADRPTIYHVAVPTKNSAVPVDSITLPYQGSTLTEGCSGANLHVLAISTH